MWPPWLNIHLIAGLEEVLAMLKEQNVIIANMTKETLKDILSRLLMGLEPPLSLSEVPETKIVEGICHIRQGHLMPFWWWCAQTHCQKHYPTWNVVFNVDVDSWGWSRGLTSCKTNRNHSMLNAWIQNMCLNCFNSHNSRLWSSPLSLLHFCSCFEKNISRPHVECTRVTN